MVEGQRGRSETDTGGLSSRDASILDMKTSRYLPEPTKRNSIRARRTRSVAGGGGFALLCSGKVLESGRMKRLLGWVDMDRTGRL